MKFIVKNWLFFVCLAVGMYFASHEQNISVAGMIFLGVLGGICIFLFVICLWGAIKEIKRRVDNEINLTSTLEHDPEKVKSRMLFIMQHGHHEGIKGALNEFDDIFRNYPQWELEKWDPFRAWYKEFIDFALEHPDIYTLTMTYDGAAYDKAADRLYDPDAPDWEQYMPEEIEMTAEEKAYIDELIKRDLYPERRSGSAWGPFLIAGSCPS